MTEPIAKTKSGKVRGAPGKAGLVFKGIPFAAPPVGALRFCPPAPVARWDGVRDCLDYGPSCIQAPPAAGVLNGDAPRSGSMSEDCLYLNVFTPALDDARRPTMVWIHGGGFTGGSGSLPLYDGRAFTRDGVVLVTINYRLHALGVLYLDELFDGARGTGNLGMLDQAAALEWVRDNIAAFGGDPNNVTIFGESAGGDSVATLLAMPTAAGLFKRAIPQSGNGDMNLTAATARRITQRVLDAVGVKAGDWSALRALPAERLVEASARLRRLLQPEDGKVRLGFAPVIDGTVQPGHPTRRLAAGCAAGIDLMVGTCADESRLFRFAMPRADQERMPPPDVAALFAPVKRTPEEVMKVYSAGRPEASTPDLHVAIETDEAFRIPAIRMAEAQLRHNRRVWMYRFTWRTPVLGGRLGACHALELPFVFERLRIPFLVGDAPPIALAGEMHAAWVRFASSGDPSGGSLPAWSTYDLKRRATLEFDTPCRLTNDPAGAERQLWDGVI
jgi:para-nitrobenzyl esterase